MLTCERLFDTQPKLYFWTFTFKRVHCDWQYSYLWAGFIRDMSHRFGECLFGVRVLETHKEHGLHYHAILNKRINVHMARKIGKKYGMGIMHVKRCDRGAINYLVPYLQKDNPLYSGIRRWNTVGGFRGVKTKNIQSDNPYTRNMVKITGGRQSSFPLATTVYNISKQHGDIQKWPEREKAKLPGILQSFAQESLPKRIYHLRSRFECNWNTIRKPQKIDLSEERDRALHTTPIKFGCMVWIPGAGWQHESRVKVVDGDTPF